MLGALALLLLAHDADADGGLMRVSETAGPYVITVFTAPTPLRVGSADVSVLVQSAADRTTVLDAAVEVRARSENTGSARQSRATRGAATNKLLYASAIELPAAGPWTVEVHVRGGHGSAAVACHVEVEPARSALGTYWPYFLAPFVVLAAYALHQMLLSRSAAAEH